MLATYVPPVVTPIRFEEAVPLMRWALAGQLNCVGNESAVHDGVLALALAKVWLETGRGQHCWNFNWGNVKAASNYAGMFTTITLNEVLNGKLVWFAPEGELTAAPSKGGKLIGPPIPVPDGHPQTRMRAFANHYDGVDCYVDFVAHGRYSKAWGQLLAGSPTGYIHELKAACYFTADEALYTRGVVALRDELLCKLRNLPMPKPVDLEWEQLVRSVPGVQFDLGALRQMEHGLDLEEIA